MGRIIGRIMVASWPLQRNGQTFGRVQHAGGIFEQTPYGDDDLVVIAGIGWLSKECRACHDGSRNGGEVVNIQSPLIKIGFLQVSENLEALKSRQCFYW